MDCAKRDTESDFALSRAVLHSQSHTNDRNPLRKNLIRSISCPESKQIQGMEASEILQVIEMCEKEQNYSMLIRTIGSLFNDEEVLGRSFIYSSEREARMRSNSSVFQDNESHAIDSHEEKQDPGEFIPGNFSGVGNDVNAWSHPQDNWLNVENVCLVMQSLKVENNHVKPALFNAHVALLNSIMRSSHKKEQAIRSLFISLLSPANVEPEFYS